MAWVSLGSLPDGWMDGWLDGYVTGACYFCLEHTPIKWTGCGPMKLLLIINHVGLRLRAETGIEREGEV